MQKEGNNIIHKKNFCLNKHPKCKNVLCGTFADKLNAIILHSFESGVFEQILSYQIYDYYANHQRINSITDIPKIASSHQKSLEHIDEYTMNAYLQYYDEYLKSEIYPIIETARID